MKLANQVCLDKAIQIENEINLKKIEAEQKGLFGDWIPVLSAPETHYTFQDKDLPICLENVITLSKGGSASMIVEYKIDDDGKLWKRVRNFLE